MARPRKGHQDKRGDRLNPRLTTTERAEIEQQAAAFGLSPSEYMRRRSLGHRLPPAAAEAHGQAVLATALMRIGVNLNQMARHMNAGKSPSELALFDLLTRINSAMDGIYDTGAHRRGPQL